MSQLVTKRQRRPKQKAQRRLLHFEQYEERLLLSISPSGDPNSELGLFASDVSENLAIRVRIETSDVTGAPISEASVGEEFLVNLYVQDTRENAKGVFAAYLDLSYDPALVRSGDLVQFGDSFPHGRTLGAATPGLLDEVGGFSGAFTGSGSSETLLMSMSFVATHSGQVDFVGDQPDYLGSIPLVFGHDFGVPFNEVDFGRATINVLAHDLSESSSVAINAGSTSSNSAPMLQPPDLYQNAEERYWNTPKLLGLTGSPNLFVPTRTASPLASNGGFNDLDGLQFSIERDASVYGITYEFDANSIRYRQEAAAITIDSQLRDTAFSREFGVRLEPSAGIRRVAEDHLRVDAALYLSRDDNVGAPNEIRGFTSAELPNWNDTTPPTRPTTEFDTDKISEIGQTRNALPRQATWAALADTALTTGDESIQERKTQQVAFSTPTGNGGYINLANLRQVDSPTPVDVPDISAIHIARTDSRPASDEVARTSNDAGEVALASLTWQLQVDGSRAVSLAFEMAEESQAARAARPIEIRGAAGGPRKDSRPPAASSDDAADLDAPIMPPNAKTASFNRGTGADNVRDEHRHYLAVSPLIVFVAGSLLVTEGWQKLQPRDEKHKLR